MRSIGIQVATGWTLAALAVGASARGDMVLTLEAKDMQLAPISGGVPAGTRILVDIFAAVDDAAETGRVISAMDFSFDASSASIVVDSFSFLPDMSAYFFQSTNVASAGAFALDCAAASCVPLTLEPTALARIEVIVNGPGQLNVAGFIGIGGGEQSIFTATDPAHVLTDIRFSLSDGNLQGGLLDLTIADAGGGGGGGGGGGAPTPGDNDGDTVLDEEDPDDDNDDVPDEEDAFPLDDEETTDTDDDGVGDSADADDDDDGVEDEADADPLDPEVNGSGGGSTPVRGPCGIAMVQTSVLILLGLTGMGHARRRRLRIP